MPVIAIAIGAATFVVAHVIEAAAWNWFGGAHAPWFLNSGRAVAFTAACFFAAGALAGAVLDRGTPVRLGVWIGAGGLVAAVVVLFWRVGPGNLFPIAIAVGALVLFVSSVAGVSATRAVKRTAPL
jgi:hypothetical protein